MVNIPKTILPREGIYQPRDSNSHTDEERCTTMIRPCTFLHLRATAEAGALASGPLTTTNQAPCCRACDGMGKAWQSDSKVCHAARTLCESTRAGGGSDRSLSLAIRLLSMAENVLARPGSYLLFVLQTVTVRSLLLLFVVCHIALYDIVMM